MLLKNEGGLLPLKGVKRLAVIGRLADTPNTGDGGSSNTRPAYVVTPLQGMRAALGEEVEITYDDGSDVQRGGGCRARGRCRPVRGGLHAPGRGRAGVGRYDARVAPYFPEPTPEEEPIVAALMRGMAERPPSRMWRTAPLAWAAIVPC